MTILGRLARDLAERLLGRFREGPATPPRFAEDARLFRVFSRGEPTEEEWEAFAVELADRAYQDGFVRGLHWLERSWEGPAVSPERVLEEQANQRRLADDPKWREVLENPMTARRVHEFHDGVGHAARAGITVYRAPGRRERH